MYQVKVRNLYFSATGFTLLEVSIAMILMASLTLAWLMIWATETQKAQSRFAGQQYRTIGLAIDNYMSLYHDQIQKLPTDCSFVAFAESVSLASSASVILGKCFLKLKSIKEPDLLVPIANGLQPSITELQSLHLLDAGFRNQLILPIEQKVAMPLHHSPSSTLAPPGYAIQIKRMCLSIDCEKYQMTGFVFNTQPYLLNRLRSLVSGHELLQDAWAAAGPDAMLSTHLSLGGNGELSSWGGAETITNPLRSYISGGAPQGIPGVLAVRIGYGALTMGEFARVDGSRPITGTWNFGGQEVQGIKQLTATAVTADSIRVSGDATVNSLQAGSIETEVSNTRHLTVPGKANVRELVIDGTGKLLLPTAIVGQACDSSRQSLAISADFSQVIICNARLRRWAPNP